MDVWRGEFMSSEFAWFAKELGRRGGDLIHTWRQTEMRVGNRQNGMREKTGVYIRIYEHIRWMDR